MIKNIERRSKFTYKRSTRAFKHCDAASVVARYRWSIIERIYNHPTYMTMLVGAERAQKQRLVDPSVLGDLRGARTSICTTALIYSVHTATLISLFADGFPMHVFVFGLKRECVMRRSGMVRGRSPPEIGRARRRSTTRMPTAPV